MQEEKKENKQMNEFIKFFDDFTLLCGLQESLTINVDTLEKAVKIKAMFREGEDIVIDYDDFEVFREQIDFIGDFIKNNRNLLDNK